MTAGGRILYVVGFDDTEAAVSWQVAELSKAWRTPIVLLGVRRRPWLPFLEREERLALKRATVDVGKRLRGLRAHVAGIKVAFGDVAEHACRVADQSGAGLIMIGAGPDAMDDPRAMSPSALTIARRAQQDVWICKPFADPHIDHVLCAADTSPLAGEAVRRAAAICRQFNARLRLLSVLLEPPPPPPNVAAAGDDPDEAVVAGRRRQKLFLDQFDLRGIALSRAIVWGTQTPVELLLEAEQYSDGVLVMGAMGQAPGRRALGTTTEPVLRACPSSVLIVRAGRPRAAVAAGTPVALTETADGG